MAGRALTAAALRSLAMGYDRASGLAMAELSFLEFGDPTRPSWDEEAGESSLE